jgi:hypothetical protein
MKASLIRKESQDLRSLIRICILQCNESQDLHGTKASLIRIYMNESLSNQDLELY